MKVSAKGDYAARALLELTLRYDGRSVVHIREIAKRQGIPEGYLVKIMAVLKGAGFVKSRRGVEGGYMLSMPPSEITLGDVIRLVDGPLLPLKCGSEDGSVSCERQAICDFRPIWQDVRDAVSVVVDNITYEDMRHSANRTANMYHI